MAAGLEKPGAELYCPTCEQTFVRGERCPTDNTRLVRIAGAHDQLIGRELDGRYTIIEQLGAGGMGAVYRGTQHQLGREVAIKVVTPSLVKEPLVIKRFLREAKLASRLSHPNAVSVVDFGQTEDGLFFLVMELVNGRTLDDIVMHDGKLAPARVVRIGTQVCEALEGAHSLQIIHRDLKPQNIMVMSTGRDLVKVLDFGLAKSLSPEQGKTTMTNAGALLGTPAFMPPELVLGNACDSRADLYSLGCVLYVCASGRLPFPSSSVHEVIAMHATEPASRIEGLPPRLWAVIDRLLEKNPDDRYQTAGEAREALERAVPSGRSDTDDGRITLRSESPTVLGWEGSSGVRTAPGKRGGARIATPIGVPRVSIVPSSVDVDDAEVIASSATLPSDALAAELAAQPALAGLRAPSPSAEASSPAHASVAPAPAPAPTRTSIGWKPIALVMATAVAAAAIAFVIVERLGSSDAPPASTTSPTTPTTPPATSTATAPPTTTTTPATPTTTTSPATPTTPPATSTTSPTPTPPTTPTTTTPSSTSPTTATPTTTTTPSSTSPTTAPPTTTTAPTTPTTPPSTTHSTPPTTKIDGSTTKVSPTTKVDGSTTKVSPTTKIDGSTTKVSPTTKVDGSTTKVSPTTKVDGSTTKVSPTTKVDGSPTKVSPTTKVDGPASSKPAASKKVVTKAAKPKSVDKKPAEKPAETLPPRRPVKTNPGVM